MSEIGIATMATDKIVLAVISHLNEGNIEDAVALFIFHRVGRILKFLIAALES